jgi:hypothetical protein
MLADNKDQPTTQLHHDLKKSETVTRHLPMRLCTAKAGLEEDVIPRKRAGGSSVNNKSRSVEGYIAGEYGYSPNPDGNQSWWRRCSLHPVELQGKAHVDHAEMYAAIFEVYARHASPLAGALSVGGDVCCEELPTGYSLRRRRSLLW